MSRIKYHNGQSWVYADMAVQVGGGVSYDLTVSGTVSAYPTESDWLGADYDANKTMAELLTKFNTTGKLDIDGTLNLQGQLGTTTRYRAIVPYGDYVPYAVVAAAIAGGMVSPAHTPDSDVDALLLKVCDARGTSTTNGQLFVYQSGNNVYIEAVSLS